MLKLVTFASAAALAAGAALAQPAPPPPPGAHEMMIHMIDGMDHLDANKDGRVTFEEFAAPMREHFNELDKNKSGALEKDEFPGDHMIIEKRIEKHD